MAGLTKSRPSPGTFSARGFRVFGFSQDANMETKRDRRRRDLQRMKAKALQLRPHDPKAQSAEYLASCSCWMCGNPRRYMKTDRLTLQERRADPLGE